MNYMMNSRDSYIKQEMIGAYFLDVDSLEFPINPMFLKEAIKEKYLTHERVFTFDLYEDKEFIGQFIFKTVGAPEFAIAQYNDSPDIQCSLKYKGTQC